ncbi:putative RWD domain-containing protein [Neospora caninum Liverpool]|uniref:Putative RWD domain-containing protein n=1 Tax=Neospora caninum (strain Liverpool) TaxID=572307 RepID=F0VN70_NEOCL|nr:putative RWD domain-containing protein [Neospora caninum Liverpool]CBZ55166.1 putative RWD domain-containing protein [Neospora caninum Liverpool]CEL69893.1 TPA: RWD domain-containing protein, putative [Neospora caninum Liverpool]|eukprot:XP_003885194.1 putative RWD domain-containing protein [Neospora caninum Liverpool]
MSWSPPSYASPLAFPPCDCPAGAEASPSGFLSPAAAEELEALRSIYGDDEIRFHPCCRLLQVRTETTRSRVRQDALSLLALGAPGGRATEPEGEDDDHSFSFLLQLFLPLGYLDPDFKSPACLVHTRWDQPPEASQRMQNKLLALQGEGDESSFGHPGLFDFVECVRNHLPLPPHEARDDSTRPEQGQASEGDRKRQLGADAQDGCKGNGGEQADDSSVDALEASLSNVSLEPKQGEQSGNSLPSPYSPSSSTELYIGPTVTVHKSRFVGVCAAVHTHEEVRAIYQHVRQRHFGATHHIMAYSFRQKVARKPRNGPPRKDARQAPRDVAEEAQSPVSRLNAARGSSPATAPPPEEGATAQEDPVEALVSSRAASTGSGNKKKNRARGTEKETDRDRHPGEEEEEFIENCDHDSDGETAAGRKLQQLLYNLKARNVILIVTRWYGGIHLGPDRFRVIATVGRQALDASGLLEEAQKDAAKKEPHRKKASGKGDK